MDEILVWQIIKEKELVSYTLGQLKKHLDQSIQPMDVPEKFMEHPEYNGYRRYRISNWGQIECSNDHGCRWELIKQVDKENKPGWKILEKYNKSKYIYRFVAETWLDKDLGQLNAPRRWEILHINENGDNRPENLIWLKSSYHRFIHHNL